MLTGLKNHPFAVEAFFKSALVLTFAVPKKQLYHCIPECLLLDTFQNQWAFIAIALVQTTALRPKGFPKWMGNNFFLIGYRIFVRFTNMQGKRLRGLYILKSETNKKHMEVIGNICTHYNYTTTDIHQNTQGGLTTFSSVASKFHITFEAFKDDVTLPNGSPFTHWKQARRFAGPLPHTFTYNKAHKTVLIVEGVRQNWNPKPVHIKSYAFNFLKQQHLQNATLCSAFELTNIPYYWKKGKIAPWH